MNDLQYFELHKYVKRKYLAKGNNYMTFDNSWCFDKFDENISFAVDDFKECLKKSFNIVLGENTDKKIKFTLKNMDKDAFFILVNENVVEFIANDFFMLVQSIFYAEDLMKQYGDCSLEKKEYFIRTKISNRFATSAIENCAFTKEYTNILLHYGYNGAILYAHDNDSLENLRAVGMKAYLNSNEKEYYDLYDGVIDDDGDILLVENTDAFVEVLEKTNKKIAILSYDAGQAGERDGVEFLTKSGALAMAQPSDNFKKLFDVAQKRGIEVWVQNFGCGKTDEIPAIPYVPAMMQWFMRLSNLHEYNVSCVIESGKTGFIPSIVGEFSKMQNFVPCDEGGICIQKIASLHFGAENVEKVMMAFKKVTDGVNYFIYNSADSDGPLLFGPAYPLVNSKLYQYDFSNNDITYETDLNLKAADCFNKASLILSHIENDEAKQLSNILAFLVNTLVTCANVKRWYRRIHVLENNNDDYKKKFLCEQLLKIGEQEIKNAYDTADILIKAPFLEGSNTELLCTANALDAKIRLTEKAVEEIRKKII